MDKRNLCILVKSCKDFVVLRCEVLPRVADFAGILEVSESNIALAVLFIKNIISTVGVERNSQVLVLHNLISLEHSLRRCCADMIKRLKL